MNTGIIFALLAALSFALSAFPYTFLHQYANTKVVTLWRLFFASILIILVSYFVDGLSFYNIFSNVYLQVWLWVGLSGVITFLIGDFLIFESYAVLGPAKGSLLTALSPAMALIFGIILLNDSINIVGLLGIAITIIGVIIVNMGNVKTATSETENNESKNKAIIYGVLGACCLGIGIALSKKGAILAASKNIDLSAVQVSFIRIFVPFLVYLLIAILLLRKESYFAIFKSKKGLQLLLYGALVNPTTGILFSMYSIATIDVAIAQTIFSISPLLALAINIFYFKQKATLRNILGACIAIVGVLVLIFRDGLF